MDAPDARAVVERLQRDAYFPITIAPKASRRSLVGLAWPERGRRRIPSRDLVALPQQIATLLEAGLPLDRVLGIQAELAPNPHLRTLLADVLRGVRSGSSLADALAKHHPRPFSRLYINMVRAGEKGGVLESTLGRLGQFLDESQEFRDALVSALIYPALLSTVGAAAVVFLMTFVIPRFAAIFNDLGTAIPLPTLILLEVSGAIQRGWWLLALVVAGGVLASRMVLATPRGRLAVDRLLLGLLVVGEVILKTEVARFTRILGTLLKSGIGMIPALAGVKERLSNRELVGPPDGAAGGAHHSRPHRGAGGAPALRPRGAEQAGRRPRADRAVRRGPRPVSPGHRRLPARGGRVAGAGQEPERVELERAVSQEARGAGGSVGPSLPVQVLPG